MLGEAHGLIRCVAKGARKVRNRFGGRLQPATHLNVRLWRGRGDLDTLTSAESVELHPFEHPRLLADKLELFGKAMAMLEAAGHLALERTPNPALYDLLVRGLRSLHTHPSPLIVGAFLWRLAQLEGIAPAPGFCVGCEEPANPVALDLERGGFTCAGCCRGAPLRPETARIIRDSLEGRTAAVLGRTTGQAASEFERLGVRILERHIERPLRALYFVGRVASLPSDASAAV